MSFLTSFKLSDRLKEVLFRFPLVIFFALSTTAGLLFFIEDSTGDIFRWPVSAFIGFLAILNWSVFNETYKLSKTKYWFGIAIIVLLLWVYISRCPSDLSSDDSCFWFVTVGLSFILHLLISLVPFLRNFDRLLFVHYNINIFVAWIQSAFYAVTLFWAMSLAFLALDQLFNVTISSLFYFRLFIVITGVFQVAFFLSDFPDNFYQISKIKNYAIFKVFISYVAIPITLIYCTILLAYIIRIGIFGYDVVEWVYVMCIWYFVIGILTFLFSLYFEATNDNQIMVWFRKWFFNISIPALILFVFSLTTSIMKAGIKSEFYLSAMIAAFVVLIIGIMILPVKKDLRLFPAILILLSVISFFGGPVSICELPVANQQKRLLNNLTEMGIIRNGVISIDTLKTYATDDSEFSNRVYYLSSMDALRFLKELDANGLLNDNDLAASILNVVNQNSNQPSAQYFSIYSNDTSSEGISDFDLLLYIVPGFQENKGESYSVMKGTELCIILENKEVWKFEVADDIFQLYKREEKQLVILKENDFYKAKILLKSASGFNDGKKLKIEDIQGLLLLKKK
jgi:hypothetical protein